MNEDLKKMISKRAKSVLAILLSAVMIVGMIPAVAFAESEGEAKGEEINLLVEEETDAQKIKEEIRKRIEELKEKISEINEKLKAAVGGKSISELIEELEALYAEFKEIGSALYQLPEYTDLINFYAEVLGTLQETTFILEDKVETLEMTSEEMKDQISDFENQLEQYKQQAGKDDELIAKLTAKAIRANIQTNVTFPDEKVKIVVNWDKDENAAGYTFKVNGVVTEPTATATGFEYVDNAANVGETYSFEVRPYIIYKDEKIEGRTYKATVVPKVTLSKGVIKSLKKGTKSFTVKWKKVSGASGYQVSYKISGKKAAKKTVTGGNKTTLKVKDLQSGKKYTVKVRAWKTVNGKKYYGKWSNAKKVTVK